MSKFPGQRLLGPIVLSGALFAAVFGATFLALGVATAQPAGSAAPADDGIMPTPPVEEGDTPATGTGVDPDPSDPPATAGAPGPGGSEPPMVDHGSAAPVVDRQAGRGDTKAETGTPDAAHGAAHGGHGDPSKHFNFFNFSYGGKDVTGEPFGDGKMGGVPVEGEEAMSPPFILMIVNFAILLALLAWKGGPIFRKLAEDRHDAIKNALDEAAQLRKQAADKLAELETKVKDADAEIKKLVDGMRADAEADKARILANAEKQAAQMKRDAELRIAAEIENARVQLTKEVTAAATLATEKILREQLQPADQQKLVAAFIADVQTSAAASKESLR